MIEECKNNKVILGLMRIQEMSAAELYDLITQAIDLGIHYFDISDVYGNHECEERLGQVLKMHPFLRKKMIIQSKCGIEKNEKGVITKIDLSKEHILSSLDASLKRMNLDYLDAYLLHRVDIFMDAKEIASAFRQIRKAGKVRYFGVSNMDIEMMKYLRSEIKEDLVINQLQLGLGQLSLISQCLNVNSPEQVPLNTDGLFFYLKRKDIALQCWSPLQYGFIRGSIFQEPKMKKTVEKLNALSGKYDVTPACLAYAFVLCLSPNIQIITGSTNPEHLKDAVLAKDVKLSKEDWYDLYCSTGNLLP